MPERAQLVLGRAASALARSAERAHDLQHALSGDASPAPLALQDLDLLTQEIAALADYLHGLAQACEPDWRLDAARLAADVPLADLAGRLDPDGEAAAGASTAGELDLF